MAAWPGSTRSRTRRAASARRRLRSTSPPASRRPASDRSSSTSTRRRTRRPASACAPTARRATTCSTAPRSRSSRSTRSFANLDLVPSKPELAGAVVELAQRGDGERYLSQALASGTSKYAFVFLDCPPSLGPLTVNALAAADRVLVPVQAEYFALEGLTQLMQSIDLDPPPAQPEPRHRRRPADDGRLAHPARAGRRGGGAQALRRRSSSKPRCRARCASRKHRATGCRRSPTTAARREPTRTGRWRWSLSSAANRRGLGRGLEVLVGGIETGRPSCSSCLSKRSTRTRSSRASASTPRRARASQSRSVARA